MSIITIITIGIIVVFVVGVLVYFCWTYRKDLREIKDIQLNHRSDKLLIDYYRVVDRTRSEYNPQYFRRVMCWSDKDDSVIFERGYLEAVNWMDDLRYAGIKVRVRIHNFELPPEPSKITSSVLYNVYNSRSVSRFITGMTKIGFPAMDIKSLGLMIPVVIGLIVGMMYFLGVF